MIRALQSSMKESRALSVSYCTFCKRAISFCARLSSEFDQIGHILANLGASLFAEGSLGLEKIRIQTEVHLDVTRLLVSCFVEFFSLDNEFHRRGFQQPGSARGVRSP